MRKTGKMNNISESHNFKSTPSWPTSPNGSRDTGHESRFIQNEPKLIYKETSPKVADPLRWGDSKSVSLGLCPWSKYEKRTQFTFNNRISRIVHRELCKTNPISTSERRGSRDQTRKRYQFYQKLFTNIYPSKAAFTQKYTKNRKNHNFLTLTYLTPYIAKVYMTICQGIRFTLQELRETKKCKTNPIHFQESSIKNRASRIEHQESCIENMQNKPNFWKRTHKCLRNNGLRKPH